MEGNFFNRILRGPETGSGSGGDHQIEDPEAVKKDSLRKKIDTLLADEMSDSVRTAYQEMKKELEGNTIAVALHNARGLLMPAEQEEFDSIGEQYRVGNGLANGETAQPSVPKAVPAEISAAPIESPAEVASPEAMPAADEAQPRVELSEEGQRREAERAKKYVDDIEERFTQKGKGNARKELKRVKGAVPDSLYQEVVRRLAERNVTFEKLPGENGGAKGADSSLEASAPVAPEPVSALPIEPAPAPTSVETRPAARVEAETDISDVGQELADALRQFETPEQRRERLTGIVTNFRNLLARDPERAEKYIGRELEGLSADELREYQEISRDYERREAAHAIDAVADAAPGEDSQPWTEAQLRETYGEPLGMIFGLPYWRDEDWKETGNVIFHIPSEGTWRLAPRETFRFDASRWASVNKSGYLTILSPDQARREEQRHQTAEAGERGVTTPAERTPVDAGESSEIDPLFSAYTTYLKNTKKGLAEGPSFWQSANNLDTDQQLVLIRTLREEDLINRGLAGTIETELRGVRMRHPEEGVPARGEGRRVARTLEGAKADFSDLMAARRDLQDVVDEIFPTLTRRSRLDFATWLRENPNVDQERLQEILNNGPRSRPRDEAAVTETVREERREVPSPAAIERAPPAPETPERSPRAGRAERSERRMTDQEVGNYLADVKRRLAESRRS